jgi:putative heme degradation protein
MVTDEETRWPVAIERLEELLMALRAARPARLIIRSPAAVAELTCCFEDFTRKDAWLNYECEQFHAHINISQIRSIVFAEKAAQRSLQCFDAENAVVFKLFFKDNLGTYDRLKKEFA